MTDEDPTEADAFDALATGFADQQQAEAIDYLVEWASDIRVRFVNHGWTTEGAETAAQSMLQSQLDRQMAGHYVIVEEDDDDDDD